jgi:hypothetical protein
MKLDLSKCEGFSTHRSGWSYAIKSLTPFHSSNGIFLDDFVERKFIWRRSENSYYNFPWVGVVHLPPHDKTEFDKRNSLQFLCDQINFKKSLKKCLCLITLSEDLKNILPTYIEEKIPIISVKHPTEKVNKTWSPFEFLKQPSITKIGYWLRKFQKFNSDISTAKNLLNYETYCLPGDTKRYSQIWDIIMMDSGQDFIIHDPSRLNNKEFDEHLSKTVAWCCMWATSANNGIIEPLIRNTPIITNRLPAVCEYLGDDYPLYDDLGDSIFTKEKILEAHEYLKNKDKTDLSGEFFAYDLITKLKDVI